MYAGVVRRRGETYTAELVNHDYYFKQAEGSSAEESSAPTEANLKVAQVVSLAFAKFRYLAEHTEVLEGASVSRGVYRARTR